MFNIMEVATNIVICARPEMAIYDAIRIMANRNITGLPVVDADLKLIGILSEKDVVKILYETRDRADQTVEDYMSTDFVSLDTNSTLIDLCDCLVDSNFRSVPITEDDKLCAIASRSDLVKGILRVKHQAL